MAVGVGAVAVGEHQRAVGLGRHHFRAGDDARAGVARGGLQAREQVAARHRQHAQARRQQRGDQHLARMVALFDAFGREGVAHGALIGADLGQHGQAVGPQVYARARDAQSGRLSLR